MEKIADMLPAKPRGFGRPIADRAAWERLAKARSYKGVIRRAEALLKQPIPESPDDLYLDFSRTGNRTRWQRVAGLRRGGIAYLTLGECLENSGRFLPALEAAIAALCAEKTWVYPAHDRSLANFKGTRIDIDLGSSHVASNLATARWLLGDKLSAKTRRLIRTELRRRIFAPYLDMVAGKRKKNWWMLTTNNWNTVCLANVAGAALAIVESRQERAKFIESAVEHSRNFLRGFTPDGYCSEGVGYWNYGFGHYILLAEAIVQATDGGVDLFERKEGRAPAIYGERIEIIHGIYPAFADCSVRARPSRQVVHFVSRRYGLGAGAAGDALLVSPGGGLLAAMMYSFPNSATKAPPGEKKQAGPGLRDWFDKAGVLIARPKPGSACRMAAALKGGHNAEHHNHNDVGSYVLVVGKRPVLLDPGGEVYTARTFSRRRYESKVLNSFGHPVPRVAGKLQSSGRRAAAKVLRTEFTDARDTLVLDIKPAYAVKELRRLQRTFVYSRQGAGSLTVTDEVEFASPQAFETALITLGQWKKLAPRSLAITDADEAVRVDIEATGDVEIAAEEIHEDTHTKTPPTRIAIRFTQPVAKATITMKITPIKRPPKRSGRPRATP